ncbi:MAG TPA: ABC transporter permease [Vicinamibacteria bacterium]|nr:ABC transporter permease [Vicinamibacteria bacterium]
MSPSLRYAVRSLLRDKSLSLLAILCMGLGIGTCVTLFAAADPWLFRPLPYPASDRLVSLRETLPDREGPWGGTLVSGPDYLDLQAGTRTLQGLAAFERIEHNLGTEGEPERVPAARVTSSLLPTLGIVPVLGRAFGPEEDRRGSHVAVIGHDLWRRRFGQDPAIVGRTLRLDGTLHAIVGVMPERFAFPEYAEVWTPLGLEAGTGDRGDRRLDVVARLAPGASVAQARAELASLAAALAREHPTTNEGRSAVVRPYLEVLTPPGVVTGLYLVLGAAVFVLLIACANVANLLLVKAAGRRREIAVRLALGARRGDVVRDFLVETSLLVGAGGALGLLLGSWGAGQLFRWAPLRPPFWAVASLDARVVAVTVAATALSALAVGLVPASRAGRHGLVEDLKEGGRGTTGGSRGRLGRLLAVSELAAALVLLVGAALMVQSFERRSGSDAGLDSRHVLTARLALAGDSYRDPQQRAQFVEELLRRLGSEPEVLAVGASNSLPFRDPFSGGWKTRGFEIEGQPVEPGRAPRAVFFAATRSFTDAAGVAVVAGRPFLAEEEAEGRGVALVSEALARRFRGGVADALGGHVRLDGGPWLRIVGVTRDVRDAGDMTLDGSGPLERVYVPYRPYAPADVALAVRTRSDPLGLAEALRAGVRSLDPALPLHSVYGLDEVRVRSAWVAHMWGQMLSHVAALAVILAVLGVYGVVAYSVSQRGHEIGIRVAVGATRREILCLVLGDGLRLATQAVVVGLVAAALVTRSLSSLLYGVGALDPATLTGCALALVLAAVAASVGPAWRGTRVDPVVALRAE